jgi:hypothetical protein
MALKRVAHTTPLFFDRRERVGRRGDCDEALGVILG